MEFKYYELSEVAEVIDSLHKTPQYSDKGYPMVRVSDMYNGYFNLPNNVKRVTEETYQEFSKKHKPTKGDILMSRVGTYGLVNYNISNQQFCLGQNTVVITNYDLSKIDNKFLYYYLLSNQTQDQIERLVTGSTQKTLSLKSIRSIKIPIISLIEQKSIANLLSSFDDKIENNNAIIANLEEQAQTIFKSWFVDFEPFKDEKFIESELGSIPRGWYVKKLKNIVNIQYGKNLPTSNLTDQGYSVFGGNGPIGFYSEYHFEEPKTLISCRGAASGKIVISLPFSFITNNSLVLNEKERIMKSFIREASQMIGFENYATGSAQPQITIKNIENISLIVPDKDALQRFDQVVSPIYELQVKLSNENIKLAEIRDLLLPKLMSGEIRVEEAITEE